MKIVVLVHREICFLVGIAHTEYNDQQITIYNNSKPNTIYTLLIQPEALKDIHGQTLQHDDAEQLIQFHVHDSPPLVGDISGATGTYTVAIGEWKCVSWVERNVS